MRDLASLIARGVGPARIRLPTTAERAAAEQDASINPATGLEEFGLWSSIKRFFGGRVDTESERARLEQMHALELAAAQRPGLQGYDPSNGAEPVCFDSVHLHGLTHMGIGASCHRADIARRSRRP